MAIPNPIYKLNRRELAEQYERALSLIQDMLPIVKAYLDGETNEWSELGAFFYSLQEFSVYNLRHATGGALVANPVTSYDELRDALEDLRQNVEASEEAAIAESEEEYQTMHGSSSQSAACQ